MPAASKLLVRQQISPADGHHRDARGDRGGGNPGRCLAVQGLLVQRPLAGDDQRRSDQLIVEADQIQHQVDPRSERRAEQRKGGEPDATCRAGAGVNHADRRRLRQRRHRPSGRQRRPTARHPLVPRPFAARTPRRHPWARSAGCPHRRPPRSRRRRAGGAARSGRAGRVRQGPLHRRGSPLPSAAYNRAPRARAMPAPPSVPALPPMPTTIRRQPASRAAAMTSPVPRRTGASAVRDAHRAVARALRRQPVRPPPRHRAWRNRCRRARRSGRPQ